MCLYLLSNSIGQTKDIPIRSLELLKEVDIVVFEEDRPARQALKSAGIHRPYLKHNEHQDPEVLTYIKKSLIEGKKVSYMSDQGMPGLADPGYELVKIAFDVGCNIEVVPGPSSLSAALAVFPEPLLEFFFAGFLPRAENERINKLKQLKKLNVPIVIYDTPYRYNNLIKSCLEVFGSERNALLAIEVGNLDQKYFWKSLAKLAAEKIEKQNFILILSFPQNKSAKFYE